MDLIKGWKDRAPARRCEWVDQLRGWAVLVMMEVHVVNVFLHKGWLPDWLNYLNGLVAPSFIMCAGFSMAISTFKPDGNLSSFSQVAKRLGVILVVAYLMHSPGFTWESWTHYCTLQKWRELFKVDVLQCIGVSLLLLQALARWVRKPKWFAVAAGLAALGVAWLAPYLWRPGVGDGLWMPLRGYLNGNLDRGVQALFPLFPWFSFAAFGAVLGVAYQRVRMWKDTNHESAWSEGGWLLAMALLGMALVLWGNCFTASWLQGLYSGSELWRLHNTTLPSVAQRLGVVCLTGSVLGAIELFRPRFPFPNVIAMASHESLLIYILHLRLIFDVLTSRFFYEHTGIGWYSVGWPGTLSITLAVVGFDLLMAFAWHRIKKDKEKMDNLKFIALWATALIFFHWNKFKGF